MSTEQTAADFSDSLTGHDEIAVAQRFGKTVTDLAGSDPTMYRRCLVFVAHRRDGLNDDLAWTAAMDMPIKDVVEFFAEATDEDEGKDEAPEPQPESSPSGAFSPDEAETSTSL